MEGSTCMASFKTTSRWNYTRRRKPLGFKPSPSPVGEKGTLGPPSRQKGDQTLERDYTHWDYTATLRGFRVRERLVPHLVLLAHSAPYWACPGAAEGQSSPSCLFRQHRIAQCEVRNRTAQHQGHRARPTWGGDTSGYTQCIFR